MSNNARHLLSLSSKEKADFIDSFNLVLSDCDGVIWPLTDGIILDSFKGINAFKKLKKDCKFVSNNSLRSDEEYLQKFKEIGIEDVKKEDIIHPAKSISYYLNAKMKNPVVYSLASNKFNNFLLKNGLKIVKPEHDDEWTIAKIEKLAQKARTEAIDAVIFDVDYNLNFSKLIAAEQFLKQPNCELIVGATESRRLINHKIDMMLPFSCFPLLCQKVGKVATVLGKPSIGLGQFLIKYFNIKSPNEVLFIGDSITSDIKFGSSCGFQTLLVLSGSTSKNMLQNLKEDLLPNYYIESLAEIPKLFE